MKLVGKHILVIDDDEVLIALLTRVLEVAGCKVISCTSVKDAILTLNENEPDLNYT